MKLSKKESYKVYEWDFEGLGLFQATIRVNGEIIDLRFCEHGSSLDSSLCTKNKDFLRAIYEALKELFSEVFDEKV